MVKAIGQVLRCRVTQTFYFGFHNKIESVYTEYDLPEAWLKLLNSSRLVKELLMSERKDRCYIMVDTDEARQSAREYDYNH